jgi:hypothetical protein
LELREANSSTRGQLETALGSLEQRGQELQLSNQSVSEQAEKLRIEISQRDSQLAESGKQKEELQKRV